jgi:hypothetical protein
MPALKPCIEWYFDEKQRRRVLCGELSPNTRCPEHQRRYEKRRKEKEPWLHFYTDPRWSSVRQKVLSRDGHRCTFAVGTRRCITDALLEIHHETKLRHLWERAGSPQRGALGWDTFIASGCDMRNLRVLCHEHHKFVDNNNPAEKWVGTPGERATSQHRRNFRSGKRRTRKTRSQISGRKAPQRRSRRNPQEEE